MMEQNVAVKYWRRPLLKPLLISLLWLLSIGVNIYESYSNSTKFGYSFKLKEISVVLILSLVIIVISCFLNYVSKVIRSLSILDDAVRLSRGLGRAITVNADKAALCGDYLFVGNFFSICLEGLIDKEKIKDALAGRVKVLRDEPRAYRYITNIAYYVMLSSASFPLIMLLFTGRGVWEWVLAGIIAVIAAGVLAWTARCLSIK